jgi:hypothetical protein
MREEQKTSRRGTTDSYSSGRRLVNRSAALSGSLDSLETETLALLVLLVAVTVALGQLVREIEDPLRESRDLVRTLSLLGTVLGSSAVRMRLGELTNEREQKGRVLDVLEQLVVCAYVR